MFTQLITLGRDAELRHTANGKAVCSVVGAYDIGWGDNKRTQWIEGALWEKRAESLAQYLLKGKQLHVTFDDVEVEMYEGKKGTGAKLKGRIVDVKLVKDGSGNSGQKAPVAQPATPDNFDHDIPF